MIGLNDNVVQIIQTVAVLPAILCYSQNYYIYLWRSASLIRVTLGYPYLVSMIWNQWILVVDSSTTVLYIVALSVLYMKKVVLDPTTKDHENTQRRAVAIACSWFSCHCSVLFATMIGLNDNVVHIIQTVAVSFRLLSTP
ncbi:hypothetical protein L596_025927 [Steinernema carpocapsae]|uniref:Uncharacterized protein n=1 Tax=Steinernema carpocapsae TaxID=34508 RepID=A0A4U5M981_STECR|nr:hypothetical protein L596_025927 [Steinernema carpocapsae]